MRDDRASTPQGEPGGDDVLERARGEVAQPVEPAPHTLVAATRTRMVAQRASVHADGDRLRGGEITGLGLGQQVQAIMVDSVSHKGDYIPLTSDTGLRFSRARATARLAPSDDQVLQPA
jgi:hypothetical protein